MSWTGVLGCDMVAINCGTLCSRSMWLIGGRPVHALIDGQNEHFNLVQLNTLPFFLPEYVFDASPLSEESVDNRSTWRYHGSFQQVTQQRKNWMETLKLIFLCKRQD